jgi:hypothetical protein
VTKLPLALKFWVGKVLVQLLSIKYLSLERDLLLSPLIDLETMLIDKNLPTGEEEGKGEKIEVEEGEEEEGEQI